MTDIAFDAETRLIRPGCTAPPIVCISWTDGQVSRLLDKRDALAQMAGWLRDPSITLINHNISFDLACFCAEDPDLFFPLVFDAYDAGRIRCTMVGQQLQDIAFGNRAQSYSLENTVQRVFGESVEGKHGEDAWRLRYAELEDIPIPEWPEEAKRYVLNDSALALRLYRAQCEQPVPDLDRQVRAAWPLRLMGCWGIRTDGESVAALEEKLHLHVDAALEHLLAAGIYRKGGTKKAPKLTKHEKFVKSLVFEELGQDAPLTPGGEARVKGTGIVEVDDVSIAAETLRMCKNPDLLLLAEIAEDQKLLSTYVPLLKTGVDEPIHPFWNTLVDTGRTSCGKPNLQNQPRKPGVRECFVPRAGCIFISADYHTAELRSLAQVLLDAYGESRMAEALRAGHDLHLVTGASILGVTYEEIKRWYKGPHTAGCGSKCNPGCEKRAKDARQLAKAANFGLPGGLGVDTFIEFAAGPDYKIQLTREQAQDIKDRWLSAYPEMIQYFADISTECNDSGGRFTLVQPRSGRLRGNVGYTDGANSMFQGLTADGIKEAAYEAARRMYDPRFRDDPLYGCRTVALIHDELFVEAPESRAADAGEQLSAVMVDTMARWLPDIPVVAEAALMRRWSKAAGDAVRNTEGRLIPWEDRQEGSP